jgi:hypothetical protein
MNCSPSYMFYIRLCSRIFMDLHSTVSQFGEPVVPQRRALPARDGLNKNRALRGPKRLGSSGWATAWKLTLDSRCDRDPGRYVWRPSSIQSVRSAVSDD